VVTTAVALLLLTAFSLQSVLYPQIIQQQSSYAQEPASPITDGNASSSPPSPGNSSSSSNSSPFVEPGPPLPVEPDGGPGGQPGEPGGPTTEPQQPPLQTVDNNNLNLTKTDGILTATINGANFVRNQIIEVKGKVDDEVITPESGVWISINDSTNETTYAVFASINPADKSFSEILVAGYYDGNSYGFYKPMTVSGKNYTMTVAYNTDNGPSSTPSGNNKSSSEVQFVFAYDHSSTTPPFSAAVTAEEEEEEDTGPASAASQFAGNQSSTTTTTTPTNMSTPTTTTTARQTTTTTKTNGLLTATINSTHFTTNQTIAVNGTVGEAAGPFIAVYVELKDPHNDTLAFEFAPIVRSNKSGSDNETSFSYSLVAGDVDDGSQDDAASSDSDTRRFWKPMNETGNNYTMIVGYATPAPSSPSSSSDSAEENFRSEVQFVFAYDHLPPEEEGAAVATTTTTTTPEEELESEPESVIEPEPEPEEEESEDDSDDDNGGGDDSGDDGEDCDNSYPDECIPPPPPDLDCSDIDEDDFVVRGSDPHGFDDDNDGVGCEEDSSSSSNDDSSSSSSDDDDNNDDNDVEIDRNSISNALTNILDDIFGERLDIAADRVKNSVLDRITEDKAQIGQTIEQIAEQIADATDTD
jgi:hypothetical protein